MPRSNQSRAPWLSDEICSSWAWVGSPSGAWNTRASHERRRGSRPRRIAMARTLLDKVWGAHTARMLPAGETQPLVGLPLVPGVTAPNADPAHAEGELK